MVGGIRMQTALKRQKNNKAMRTMSFWRQDPLHFVLAADSALGFGVLTASAAVYTNDFNIDPVDDPDPPRIWGSAFWREMGSFDNTGFVSITEARTNLQGVVILPDLDSGFLDKVVGFRFNARVRIGGGFSFFGPSEGEGMSFSFADATDPVIGGALVGEEGATTGLSVSIDTSDNGHGDGPAIDIKYYGAIIAHKFFQGVGSRGPYCAVVETDAAGNPIALETEPSGSVANWVDLEIILNPAGGLSVNYKGHQIFRDFVTGYTPRVGRFIIGARTGPRLGSYHWIDNVRITTDISDSAPRVAFTRPSVPGRRDVAERAPIEFAIDSSASVSQGAEKPCSRQSAKAAGRRWLGLSSTRFSMASQAALAAPSPTMACAPRWSGMTRARAAPASRPRIPAAIGATRALAPAPAVAPPASSAASARRSAI